MINKESEQEHPFYGVEIIRRREKEYIQNLLKKYRQEPVTEDLQRKIWDELQLEKYKGHITIPFKVVIRKDISKKYPDFIEIILDSKV
jgi:hypothetical protein